MLKLVARNFCLLVLFSLAFGGYAAAQSNVPADSSSRQSSAFTVAETNRIVAEVIEKSYPELRGVKISVKTFHSEADFFRSRFSIARFLTFRPSRYLISVNPKVFELGANNEALQAIIAHELAHILYYRRHNRFELLGLMSLSSKSFTARFERGADLEAIRRGFGAGLKTYREWLYRNIPARRITEKRRNYFSPEEIERILEATKEKPELFDFWRKNIPRSLEEINADISRK